ncbi:MAG: hypothetical protein JXA96_00300 [Sedimentisphaerales bacterium]|nr:hypothetical protein [Sedimentisphaerales bacterium]
MAWKQIKTRIIGNSTNREGSLSRRMLFIWCMLASVIFYLIPQDSSNKLQLAFARVFHVPLSASRNFSLSNRTQQNLNDTVSKKKYDELENSYHNLEQRLIKLADDFQHLTNLNSVVGQNVGYILGTVSIADNKNSNLAISCKGTNGLRIGQFVLERKNCIIGRIIDISPKMAEAKVQLVTNPDSQIAVRIEGLNQDLKMQGNGDGTAKISMVSREQKISIGQNVFVSIRNGFLDSNMIVGTISRFKPDDKNPLLWDITVKPKWELEEIFEIAVIIKQQQ